MNNEVFFLFVTVQKIVDIKIFSGPFTCFIKLTILDVLNVLSLLAACRREVRVPGSLGLITFENNIKLEALSFSIAYQIHYMLLHILVFRFLFSHFKELDTIINITYSYWLMEHRLNEIDDFRSGSNMF